MTHTAMVMEDTAVMADLDTARVMAVTAAMADMAVMADTTTITTTP